MDAKTSGEILPLWTSAWEPLVTDPDGTGITVYTQGAMSWAIGKGQQIGYTIFTFVSGWTE